VKISQTETKVHREGRRHGEGEGRQAGSLLHTHTSLTHTHTRTHTHMLTHTNFNISCDVGLYVCRWKFAELMFVIGMTQLCTHLQVRSDGGQHSWLHRYTDTMLNPGCAPNQSNLPYVPEDEETVGDEVPLQPVFITTDLCEGQYLLDPLLRVLWHEGQPVALLTHQPFFQPHTLIHSTLHETGFTFCLWRAAFYGAPMYRHKAGLADYILPNVAARIER